MGLFVIQLAKMTLVVLGMFFTPIITRKFVASMNLPVAQSMMKWGGLAWAATSGGAAVALTRAGAAVNASKQFAKAELPSASYHGSRWLSSKLHSFANSKVSNRIPALQGLGSAIQKADQKIQKAHLVDKARSAGLHIPSREEIRLAKTDPEVRQRVTLAQEKLETFIRSKQGVRNPISNHIENAYVPPPGRIVRSTETISRVGNQLSSVVNSGFARVSTMRTPPAASSPSPNHSTMSHKDASAAKPSWAARVRRAQTSSPRHIKEILETYKERK